MSESMAGDGPKTEQTETDQASEAQRYQPVTADDILRMQRENEERANRKKAKRSQKGWHEEGSAVIPLVSRRKPPGAVQVPPKDLPAGFSTAGSSDTFGRNPEDIVVGKDTRGGR